MGGNEIEAPPLILRGKRAVDATRAFMISVSRPASAVEDWTRLFDRFDAVQSCREWLSLTGMGAPATNIGISSNAVFFDCGAASNFDAELAEKSGRRRGPRCGRAQGRGYTFK